uniref:Small ribosomal subunit protein uS5c n=1 Tax=Ishige okamurae TaxID=233772 RepID=A0A8E6D2P2_9PHAE|nr:ribosomal protein S5 [Ishige okamurae]QVJ99688.1 ribosomal protein S5 [Ishige okamurae]WAM63984.1 30S ribosomal protein S5 [Ishige okamurae]
MTNRNTLNKNVRWEKRVVKIARVSKVVKGGKKLSFRATLVTGNRNGLVGVGIGKAEETALAIKKAEVNAKKNLVKVPLVKGQTIPHSIIGNTGGCKVFIRPAVPGTGVIAGGAVRVVLELAGVKNILSKQLGSNNALNNARATVIGLKNIKAIGQIAQKRQISIEQVLGN